MRTELGRRVVITGAGMVCPLGDSPAAVHDAVRQGRRGLRPLGAFPTDGLGPRLAAEVADFSPQAYLGTRNLRPLDRTAQLAASAAALALAHSGWSPEAREEQEVGLVLGTMFGSVRTIAEFDRRALVVGPEYVSPLDFANTVINAAAGQTAIVHALRGVNSTIAAGAASGLKAIGYAADLIRTGAATSVLAGGAEELSFEALHGFERAGRLCPPEREVDGSVPFAAERCGSVLGEGAAFVMLEESEAAQARGARVRGEVRGHGWAYAGRRDESASRSGRALARAIRAALASASLVPEAVDAVSSAARGSPEGDLSEACALRLALGDHARGVPVTAVKAALGEALGASGAMQAVLMLESIRERFLPGIPGLDRVDPEVGLEGACAGGRAVSVHNALLTASSGDGYWGAVVLGAARS